MVQTWVTFCPLEVTVSSVKSREESPSRLSRGPLRVTIYEKEIIHRIVNFYEQTTVYPIHKNMKEKKFNKPLPHLSVRNLPETLNYYRDILGFYDEWTSGNKDGGIRRDDLRLLFGENPEHVELVNNRGSRLPIMWFVDNIDEIFKEFQNRKIKIADTLKEHPYGLREFTFIDINGYYIRVAEEVEK